ncbi:hypothetical protein MAR_006203 [Mya arenaria]|uniref:Short-chain collagen C4-like n=1 Tax=Mya arenaria TaxID=6604 RepID=A0ABY7D7U5_MYAAR|nr:hypothetical protein MAR_006203 [Mya arenaria]
MEIQLKIVLLACISLTVAKEDKRLVLDGTDSSDFEQLMLEVYLDGIPSGYAGGSHYSHSGSAANWLCLTDSPQWGYYEENVASGAKVYGGEYEFSDLHYDGGSRYFGQNLNDEDAPCAVCKSPRSSSVMIPGRKECFPGWTKEYNGYLVAGDYQHASASEFICLDERPEMIVGGAANMDGKTFYIAEAVCGSLPCPPYVQGRELTCVVCNCFVGVFSLTVAKEDKRLVLDSVDSSDFEQLMLEVSKLQTKVAALEIMFRQVYGGEYEFSDFHHNGGSKYFGQNLNDEDAPCAVCKSPRSSSVMIPGRKECFPGWPKEYNGYLVAGDYQHPSASEFICLDERPEMLVGGAANKDGKTFYLAEAVCGSLPCPPYVQGRELTCVVCSK